MINTGKIYRSLEEALTVLRTSHVRQGEHIEIRYYSENTVDNVDVLIAVGTKTGYGPGCYSILSSQGVQVVEFVTELPDVSSLKNGQFYIWENPGDDLLYKVYLSGRSRVVKPVEGEMFVQDKKGVKYYLTKISKKKFSDFSTISESQESGNTRFLTLQEYEALPETSRESPGNVFMIVSKI